MIKKIVKHKDGNVTVYKTASVGFSECIGLYNHKGKLIDHNEVRKILKKNKNIAR